MIFFENRHPPRIKACPGLDPGSGAGFFGIML
jgi:hypothetical protein